MEAEKEANDPIATRIYNATLSNSLGRQPVNYTKMSALTIAIVGIVYRFF